MSRETLERKIREHLDQILVLGSMVIEATRKSVEALQKRDIESARKIYQDDDRINQKRFEIETAVITTLATQQPVMATDLRLLASLLDVTTEIERMGDYAKGIAKICILLKDETLIKPLIDIPRMADLAIDMLQRALAAFVSGDVETTRSIPPEDNIVDDLYNRVYRELAAIYLKNPGSIDQMNLIMWAAHNLERMADRVTNICERTEYAYTGKMVEFRLSDDELRALSE